MASVPAVELPVCQEKILHVLIELHDESGGAIRGKDVAARVDRNPGTVRNQMQRLKSLQLVEGVPGRHGGYKPTDAAYDTLEVRRGDDPDDESAVPIEHEGESVSRADVDDITFSSVHHPDLCRAEIHVQGSMTGMENGDSVVVGPTPDSNLVIEGRIDGIDDLNNVLVLRIDEMTAPGRTR
ncbi:Rrf2 family transcriptional regulator [Natrialbaceae archaeon AArc-T1-2]|uniref:Rrf2 family transcriptional regulator n=1 Tax=Natrialbaceae archaeon AArc-T1-2 TaxID=3053904 RepID=UPI00255A9C76|nr:Rrf2 family transcriptional regulator [Natrialbaceae archaeon AArc-T1-2]WIV68178.1 Rrf2 family transcriptional regulator [Natrialbaceae archaeon AArc-T1-2]